MENRTKIEVLVNQSIEIMERYTPRLNTDIPVEADLAAVYLGLVETKRLLEDEPNIANVVLYEYEGRLSQDPEDFIEDLVENKEIPTFEEFVNNNFSASDIIIKLRRGKEELSSLETDMLKRYQEFCQEAIANYYFDIREVTLDLDAI